MEVVQAYRFGRRSGRHKAAHDEAAMTVKTLDATVGDPKNYAGVLIEWAEREHQRIVLAALRRSPCSIDRRRALLARSRRDPVWSKIISGANVGAAVLLGSKWATLERSGRDVLDYSVTLPAWLVGLGVLGLLGASLLVALAFNRRSLAEEAALQEPNALMIDTLYVSPKGAWR